MKETVVSAISQCCIRARDAEIPLIMLDTNDVELALEVGLHCGAVTPLPRQRKRTECEIRYDPYQSYVREAVSLQYELDYDNMYSNWNLLLGKNTPVCRMQPGMYVLKLDQRSWQLQSGELDIRIGWLRQYVQAFVQEPDAMAAVRASCILLYGDPSMLPADLTGYTEIIEEPYPDNEEIRQTLLDMAGAAGTNLNDDAVIRKITLELAGFSRSKLRTLLRGMIKGGKLLDPIERREEILNVKKQFLLQTGDLLSLEVPRNNWQDLGGMDAYKAWINGDGTTAGIKDRLADPVRFTQERGIPSLKGVLLCGVPGCGKSEAARVLHQTMNKYCGMPMVRFSISKLMGGIVGESERRMRTALKQAEAMAPCIVFIDELEKGFSGASGQSNSDSGAFKRMFGDLLTWMQENDKGCFIFATANDISLLPPEFFRSGRFDALYSVFLPTQKECISIFRVHMEKAQDRQNKQAKAMGLDPKKLPPLFQGGEEGCSSEATLNTIMKYFVIDKDQKPRPRNTIKFVSGADIEKIVTTTLEKVTMSNNPNGRISAKNWIDAVKAVIDSPTLNTQGGSVSGLNAIAECYLRLLRGNFIPVSSSKNILLKKEEYQVYEDENGRITGKYQGTAPADDYDRALYEELTKRINRMAPVMEQREAQCF